MTKHIFVTGGVVSSLGKGLTSASIGMLLERRGLRVRMQKMDPYINVDPGTMSPYQHGEVYVLDDGAETDLDLGHYERFTHAPLNKDCNYTTGKIYLSVIEKERRGDYKGKTVQVIPHITDEIKNCIRKLAGPDVDVVITEIGGTVGDIEGMPFFEAIRQFALEVGKQNCLFIHLEKYPAVAAVISPKGLPIFTYVALNGKSRYSLPDGQLMPVRGVVASVLHCPGGIAMTLGTARGCGLDIQPNKVPGLGTSFKTTLAKAHVQELRLEVFLAPDYTTRRDLLLKDLDVWVDLYDSDHLVWFGPQFWRQHFVDPVYACGPDRTWKLYGRVAPDLLADPKTRPENLNK
ncbi:MAG: hypothetical protein KatS3mg106_653 [Gemmataceae bacterium]|nr:MAG: hypothetical protein KatS3mg106_653 [Gemmataceae bacterium]